ncbi:hypothetical protein SDC9_90061 [bioreactor metagenome]|uniref:Uncharacterized protein n=1 Tax=bioreactor metagenome TaxID=1076179 RepID=A0A644ZSL8_9ZZZZ
MSHKKASSDEEKGLRLLSMLERFNRGEVIHKRQETERYNVTEKTFYRDINTLREHFEITYPDGFLTIKNSRKKGGYYLDRDKQGWLSQQEVMATAKVLLESRAFPDAEIVGLLDKILLQCNPESRKHVSEVIRNERYHYQELNHGKPLMDLIWDLSWAIRESRLVEILYRRVKADKDALRVIEPLGIMFSEFYFYLVANIYDSGYEYPAVYRLDRISKYKILAERFKVQYAHRFEEGEFRKRIQFMKQGKLTKIQFKFRGESLEAVLDRLPTARVIGYEDGTALVEAEVFGKGIKMWLLSQAEFLTVTQPPDFVKEMKATIAAMAANYCDQTLKG